MQGGQEGGEARLTPCFLAQVTRLLWWEMLGEEQVCGWRSELS